MGKGAANEREKARDWSLWWSEGEDDGIFWRSTGSGSWATVRHKKGKSASSSYGDLTNLDSRGEPLLRVVTIECKRGYSKDLDILSLIDGRGSKHKLLEFWKQVKRDSERAREEGWGGEPLLVIHRDYHKPTLIMRKRLFNRIVEYCDLPRNYPCIDIRIKGERLKIISLSMFFQHIAPIAFKLILAKEESNVRDEDFKLRK